MQIVTMDSLTFTENNTLVYAGMATDTSIGGDGVSVYGTVSTDSANFTITQMGDYKVDTEEVQKGGNLLIMPQSFDKNNGTLLMLDTVSNTEKTMSFSSRSEGKDGVYCSGQENMWLLLFWRKAVLQSTFMIQHREKVSIRKPFRTATAPISCVFLRY